MPQFAGQLQVVAHQVVCGMWRIVVYEDNLGVGGLTHVSLLLVRLVGVVLEPVSYAPFQLWDPSSPKMLLQPTPLRSLTALKVCIHNPPSKHRG